MEIIMLTLLLLAAADSKNRNTFAQLKPLADFLETGDLRKLAESEKFKQMQIGNVKGKDILAAYDAIRTITRNAGELKALADGKLPDLGKLAGILFPDTAKNLGALSGIFGQSTASESAPDISAEQSNPFAPVADIADKEIVYALTRYFA